MFLLCLVRNFDKLFTCLLSSSSNRTSRYFDKHNNISLVISSCIKKNIVYNILTSFFQLEVLVGLLRSFAPGSFE